MMIVTGINKIDHKHDAMSQFKDSLSRLFHNILKGEF